MLEARLRDTLAWLNPGLPPEGLGDAFRRITLPDGPALAVIELKNATGYEGADAVVFEALDAFDGPVGSIAGSLAGSASPREARPAHQVQQGTVLRAAVGFA